MSGDDGKSVVWTSHMDAARDIARAVSGEMVARELGTGYRIRKPRQPEMTYFKQTFPAILVAFDMGLIAATTSEGDS